MTDSPVSKAATCTTLIHLMIPRLSLVTLAALALPFSFASAADEPPPTGDEILRLVRLSYALQDHKLTGALRDESSGRKETFALTMEQQIIRFRFSNPNQIIHLDLSTAPASLREVKAGGATAVPLSRYDESVRGLQMNYEDLSLRFLYWPNAKLEKEEKVSFAKCWRVAVSAPDAVGPYAAVRVWVHQGSGGVAKMEAYNRQQQLVKAYQVRKVQEVGKTTILKEMRVESVDPATKKRAITTMTLDNPEKN
jgi:hypothetical protein